ncbi:MAG: hypothetical protein IJY30_06590 [Muribaculaceae bacterium]|nr:hypothetical protein [Muribaculaceae bacterium]
MSYTRQAQHEVRHDYVFLLHNQDHYTLPRESRQEMFDRLETTDDHGMVIVGTAVDQEGNKYYKVKNSWDTNQVYDGYFYVSEPYFYAKTMSILVNKKAIPAEISKKIN